LQQHQEELEKLGARIYIVTFDSEEVAKAYVERNELQWPLLIDEGRVMYSEYGIGKASWWTILNPLTLWKYVVLTIKGVKPQKMGSDVKQLGGDVLIDPEGVVRMQHVSEGPHDRPNVDSILALMRGD